MAMQLEGLAAQLQALAGQLQAGAAAAQPQGLPLQLPLGGGFDLTQSSGNLVGQAQANFAAAAAAAAGNVGVHSSGLPTGVPVTGRVKAWYEDKGYGFLTPDNGGPDVFVHRNQLSVGQSLDQGVTVTFEARLNPMRGKYEATRCEGAVKPLSGGVGTLDYQDGAAGGKGSGKNGPILTDPSDNMFVAGLPLDMGEEAIRGIFNQFGVVKQCRVLNANPGKPDVAALVRMGDLNQAKWLVENLNGNIPQGMSVPITVRFADNRAEKARALEGPGYGKAFGKGFGGNRFNPYETIPGATTTDSSLSASALATALAQLNQTAPCLTADTAVDPFTNALTSLAGTQPIDPLDPLNSMLAQLSPGLVPQQEQQQPNPATAALQALQGIQSLASLLSVASGAGTAPGGVDLMSLLAGANQTT